MPKHIRLERDSVALLEDVVARIKDSGYHLSQDMILPQSNFFQSASQSMKSSSSARQTVATLRDLNSTLKTLSLVVDRYTTGVVKRHCALGICGITRLPIEVILDIIDWVVVSAPGTNRQDVAIIFSHVSRTFRHAILKTPTLWTSISTASDLDKVEALLNRSAPLPIAVRLAEIDGPTVFEGRRLTPMEYVKEAIDLLKLHANSNRLGSLISESPAAFNILRKQTPFLHLPALKALELLGTELSEVPATWTTPQLTTIRSGGSLARPLEATVKFYWADLNADLFGISVSQFLRSLENSKSLETLQVVISGPLLISPNLPPSGSSLPSLTSLNLVLDIDANAGNIGFFSLLPDMPNLGEMTLVMSCEVRKTVDIGRFSRSIKESPKTSPLLKSFTIALRNYVPPGATWRILNPNGSPYHYIDFVDDLLGKMPNVESFTMDASSMKPLGYDFVMRGRGVDPFITCPRIRTIRYLNCCQIFEYYLKRLAACLRVSPAWDSFRALEIIGGDRRPGNMPHEQRAGTLPDTIDASLEELLHGKVFLWKHSRRPVS